MRLLAFLLCASATLAAQVSISVSPTSPTITTEQTKTFTATVSGTTNKSVTWSANQGTISSGVYTPPPSPGSYTVTATSQADVTKKATATVTVTYPSATVTISPKPTTVQVGGSRTFTATVTGPTNKAVNWSTTGGTITSDGVLTAPTTPGKYTVTATSIANPTKSATANVSVTLDGLLDVSGTFSSSLGNPTFFQDTPSITGTWDTTSIIGVKSNITASLSGASMVGVWTAQDGSFSGKFNLGFAGDGSSFSGSYGFGVSDSDGGSWAGTRGSAVSVLIVPGSVVLTPGATMSFKALVAGSFVKTVTWTSTAGSISPDGLLIAPGAVGLYSVKAVSTAAPTKSATSVLMVTVDGQMEVSGTFTSPQGNSVFFQDSRSIIGTWDESYFLGMTVNIVGTLNGNQIQGAWTSTDGIYSGKFIITFAADGKSYLGSYGDGESNSNFGEWSGTKQQGVVSVKLLPTNLVIQPTQPHMFRALVAGSYNKAVTWNATGGSISPEGQYISPATPGQFSLVAVSSVDSTKKGTSVITVTEDGLLDVTGTFSSDVGNPTFYQSSNQVYGDWDCTQTLGFMARLTGVLSGQVVQGTWSSTDGTSVGKFTIQFSADGASFAGTFGNNASEEDGGSWVGSKQIGVVSLKPIPEFAGTTAGGSLTLQVLVAGSYNKVIHWATTGGAITDQGKFTAPVTLGQLVVTATSDADSAQKVNIPITVSSDGNLDVSGVFSTSGSDLTVFQSGTSISGTWANSFIGSTCTLSGTLQGQIVSGSWVSTTDSAMTGLFQLTFSGDGGSFTGTFGYGASDQDGGAWSGIRQPGVLRVKIDPPLAILQPGGTQTFTATVAGSPDKSVTWQSTGGTIQVGGTSVQLIAGQNEESYTLTAACNASGSAIASSTVVVTNGINVQVSPGVALVPVNGSQEFTATVTGVADQGVIWSVSDGSISSSGVFVAPAVPGNVRVTATSKVDLRKSGTAEISVAPAPTIQAFIAAPSTINAGGTTTLSWVVTGALNVSVDNGIGSVAGQSYVVVQPSRSTTYRISASNGSGTVTQTTTVYVVVPTASLRLNPSVLTLGPGKGTFLGATISVEGSSDTSVSWSCTGGTIQPNGYTAYFIAPDTPGSYQVSVFSNADPDPSHQSTTTVSVVPGGPGIPPGTVVNGSRTISVSVYPKTAQITAGESVNLLATVRGTSNNAVTWIVAGSGAGDASVSSSGTFSTMRAGDFVVQAVSQEDPSVMGIAKIHVAKVASLIPSPIEIGMSMVEISSTKLLFAGGRSKKVLAFDRTVKAFTQIGSTVEMHMYPVISLIDSSKVLISASAEFSWGMQYIYPSVSHEIFDITQGTSQLQALSFEPGQCNFSKAYQLQNSSMVSIDTLEYKTDRSSLGAAISATYGKTATGDFVPWAPAGYLDATGFGPNKKSMYGISIPYGGYAPIPGGPQWGLWQPAYYSISDNEQYMPLIEEANDLYAAMQVDRVDIPMFKTSDYILKNNKYNAFWGSSNSLTYASKVSLSGDRSDLWLENLPRRWGAGTLTDGSIIAIGDWDKVTASAPKYEQGTPSNPGVFIRVTGSVTDTFAGVCFDIRQKTWKKLGNPVVDRFGPNITQLKSGKVLISGGTSSNVGALADCELLDLSTGKFQQIASMSRPRQQHMVIPTPDGGAIIIGGGVNDVFEIFDPVSNTFKVRAVNNSVEAPGQYLITSDGAIFLLNKTYGTSSNDPGIGYSDFFWLSTSKPNLQVDFVTINQGVERHLDDQLQQAEDTRLIWRKDVPKIAGRPAVIRVFVSGRSKASGSTLLPLTKPVKVKLRLDNAGAIYECPELPAHTKVPPTAAAKFSEGVSSTAYEFQIDDASKLTDDTKVQVVLIPDASDMLDEDNISNTYRDYTPMGLVYTKPMEVHLIPIQNTVSAGQVATLTANEVTQYQSNMDTFGSIKAFFPISWVKKDGSSNLQILNNPRGVIWAYDSTTSGAIYDVNNNAARWNGMLGEFINTQANAGAPYQDVLLNPTNIWIIGVLKPIRGSTYPQLSGAIYTDGAANRGVQIVAIQGWTTSTANSPDYIARTATTLMHEIGHGHGSPHSPYDVHEAIGKEWVDILNPVAAYTDGGIGVWGQPQFLPTWRSWPSASPLIGPAQKDLMTYSDPGVRYISDYTWSIIYRHQIDPSFSIPDSETVSIP